MPMIFNTLLREAKLPLSDVRLLRHKDNRADRGLTPYELWRDNRPQFEFYQSTQGVDNREKLRAAYWAAFVGTPNDDTLFVGLYAVKYEGVLKKDAPQPHHRDGVDKAGTCDVYQLTLVQEFTDLDGKLLIEWGEGKRTWIQRADRQEKRIMELRAGIQGTGISRLPELRGTRVQT